MRTDYALLSRFQLQSTSDQQDPSLYPPISAAAPMAMTPEQAAVWAYPQPEWSDGEIAFTLCSALLGRVHLSGHIDRMSVAQQRLVTEAISTYKTIRSDLAAAVPFWPLGLPRWTDAWVALGMRSPAATYLVVWHRERGGVGAEPARTATQGGAQALSADELVVPLPGVPGRHARPEVMYPLTGRARTDGNASGRVLRVVLPPAPSACLVRLS